jgi:hypothetical protein
MILAIKYDSLIMLSALVLQRQLTTCSGVPLVINYSIKMTKTHLILENVS